MYVSLYILAVDVTDSGYKGEVTVDVRCHGDTIPIRYYPLDQNRRRFTFTPMVAADHVINVTLAGEKPDGKLPQVKVIHRKLVLFLAFA